MQPPQGLHDEPGELVVPADAQADGLERAGLIVVELVADADADHADRAPALGVSRPPRCVGPSR